MKTPKEIQLATITFLRAFKNNKAQEIEGTFIVFNPLLLYKRQQMYLLGAILFGLLFLYLLYNALVVDAVYYWHIDLPVIIGLVVVSFFLIFCAILTNKVLDLNRAIKAFLSNPYQSPYGILITDEYYFENIPEAHHIIARDNIIRIDYEEERPNKEMYIEVVLDIGERIEVRGISYQKEEFDIKTWVENSKGIVN